MARVKPPVFSNIDKTYLQRGALPVSIVNKMVVPALANKTGINFKKVRKSGKLKGFMLTKAARYSNESIGSPKFLWNIVNGDSEGYGDWHNKQLDDETRKAVFKLINAAWMTVVYTPLILLKQAKPVVNIINKRVKSDLSFGIKVPLFLLSGVYRAKVIVKLSRLTKTPVTAKLLNTLFDYGLPVASKEVVYIIEACHNAGVLAPDTYEYLRSYNNLADPSGIAILADESPEAARSLIRAVYGDMTLEELRELLGNRITASFEDFIEWAVPETASVFIPAGRYALPANKTLNEFVAEQVAKFRSEVDRLLKGMTVKRFLTDTSVYKDLRDFETKYSGARPQLIKNLLKMYLSPIARAFCGFVDAAAKELHVNGSIDLNKRIVLVDLPSTFRTGTLNNLFLSGNKCVHHKIRLYDANVGTEEGKATFETFLNIIETASSLMFDTTVDEYNVHNFLKAVQSYPQVLGNRLLAPSNKDAADYILSFIEYSSNIDVAELPYQLLKAYPEIITAHIDQFAKKPEKVVAVINASNYKEFAKVFKNQPLEFYEGLLDSAKRLLETPQEVTLVNTATFEFILRMVAINKPSNYIKLFDKAFDMTVTSPFSPKPVYIMTDPGDILNMLDSESAREEFTKLAITKRKLDAVKAKGDDLADITQIVADEPDTLASLMDFPDNVDVVVSVFNKLRPCQADSFGYIGKRIKEAFDADNTVAFKSAVNLMTYTDDPDDSGTPLHDWASDYGIPGNLLVEGCRLSIVADAKAFALNNFLKVLKMSRSRCRGVVSRVSIDPNKPFRIKVQVTLSKPPESLVMKVTGLVGDMVVGKFGFTRSGINRQLFEKTLKSLLYVKTTNPKTILRFIKRAIARSIRKPPRLNRLEAYFSPLTKKSLRVANSNPTLKEFNTPNLIRHFYDPETQQYYVLTNAKPLTECIRNVRSVLAKANIKEGFTTTLYVSGNPLDILNMSDGYNIVSCQSLYESDGTIRRPESSGYALFSNCDLVVYSTDPKGKHMTARATLATRGYGIYWSEDGRIFGYSEQGRDAIEALQDCLQYTSKKPKFSHVYA